MASEEEVVIDLRKMKMADLKRELQLRSLKVSGNKHELIERLQTYMEEHEGAEVDDEILKEEEEGEADDLAVVGDAVLVPPTKDSGQKEEDDKPDEAPETKQDDAEEGEEKSVAHLDSPTGLSDAEKLKLRAQKFGINTADMNADVRKAARSERFGTGSAVGGAPVADADKLKKRAERFGGVVSSTSTLSKSEDEERRRKRQARFGDSTSIAGAGLGEDGDKKRKRGERFGLVA